MLDRALILLGLIAVAALTITPLEARPSRRANAQNGEARIDRPGDHAFSFSHGGLTRQYLVHVPKNYRAGAPTPMVMALHGGGGGMRYQANDENYGLITASERYGFIAVFPNGYSKNRRGLFATWNAGACCGDARDRNIDDVRFLKEVVARVKRQTNIDAGRVYSIGMSNGALMSYRLACEIPGVITGVMAVAGTDNTLHCTPSARVPILHVHALNDTHVLYEGGAGADSFRDPSKVTEFTSVPATIAKWIDLNGARTTPERVLSVSGAWCDLHRAQKGGAPVQLCVTQSGGHSWPGGVKSRADEPPSQAIIANDVMWDFFSHLR